MRLTRRDNRVSFAEAMFPEIHEAAEVFRSANLGTNVVRDYEPCDCEECRARESDSKPS